MRVFYNLAYRLGFHPWEDLAEHPPFAGRLISRVAREEQGAEPPYGRALDLGCGSAVWGVLVLDTGTFHGLHRKERRAMGRETLSSRTPTRTSSPGHSGSTMVFYRLRRRDPGAGRVGEMDTSGVDRDLSV